MDQLVEKNRALEEENAKLRRKLETEITIVDRVWQALGKSTYEECKPYSIDEWVSKIMAQRDALAAALQKAPRRHWNGCRIVRYNDSLETCDCWIAEADATLASIPRRLRAKSSGSGAAYNGGNV